MISFFRRREISRIISLIILGAILDLLNGCYYYKVSRSAAPMNQTISNLRAKNKYFIIHNAYSSWHLTDIVVDRDTLTGKVSVLVGHDKYKTTVYDGVNRWKKYGKKGQPDLITEVHIYTNAHISDSEKLITIPVKDIEKVDIYNPANGAIAASWLSLVAVVILTVLIIRALNEPFRAY